MHSTQTMKALTKMTLPVSNVTLQDLQQLCASRLNHAFEDYLAAIPSEDLRTAMQYTMRNGGKRLRPLLIYATGAIFDAPLVNLDVPAAAVEMIHTYSLIHDDLPCMDDADLRRGQVTCHKQFNEGLAVLTGDALHTLAMQIIADQPAAISAEHRLQMISTLSKACGPYGMAAGQALDITVLSDPKITTELLLEIYRLKTGALFTACIDLGRLAAGNDDVHHQASLREFGDCIGLAFQIQDDILDIEAETDVLGKPKGIDVSNNKMTYPQIHGLSTAKEKVDELYQQALDVIDYLGNRADLLKQLAGQMLKRDR